jgi:uncharacterized membrane protein
MKRDIGRLEAFSDGVFSIAITLLALELKVPHLEHPSVASLAGALRAQWPAYLTVATSFFTVLIMWVHHHILFKLVAKADAKLMFANGLLLLIVTTVPFPTAVVAEYLLTPAAPAAVAFYCGTFVMVAVAFYLTLMAALRQETLMENASAQRIRRFRRDYSLGPPLYLAALVVAPFQPWIALAICTGLWVFWAATTGDCT